MNRIVLIVRGDVNVSPTVSNYLLSFLDLGYDVHCICSSVKVKVPRVTYHEVQNGVSSGLIAKLYGYFKFGSKVSSVLKEINCDRKDIFWVSRIDTALCLTNKLKGFRSILALHELHDSYFFWQKITKKVLPYYNQVVYNESNRAQIARVKYNLKTLPSVIPNKPSEHPLEKRIPINDEDLYKLITQLDGKKIIIYQGSLQSDRSITELVKATAKLSDDFVLLIMGKDPENRLPLFKTINPNLVYVPWVVPPDHLNVTSYAYIGVAFYDTDCLNSIYCAPNKIWEYSGFGIPVLGQNIPGLINTVENFNYGKCVDINSESSILAAINFIDDNYDLMSSNAKNFYNSVDFKTEVEQVLRKSAQ